MDGVREVSLEARACECCGGSDLEPVWSGQVVSRHTQYIWRFPFNVVVCRNCGFCFNSPGPRRDDLARYYADGLTGYKQVGLPYDIDARVVVLERYAVPQGVFAEIGGDEPGEFHRSCASLFGKQLRVELSGDTSAELSNVNDLAENSVDVLVHYDVLEHVVEVKSFLAACYRALKPGGVMICEVPDIRLYPRNLLLLIFEHVNHFSTATLPAIASQVGLNLIELGHMCSRPYGFLAVFRKEEPCVDSSAGSRYEYLDALACLRGGLEQIRRSEAQIESLKQRITALGASGKKITLWAVNDLLRHLLENYTLPESAIVVDSDPRRKDHLENYGVVVLEPRYNIEHIAESDLLVICAARYQSEIVDWVTRTTGKMFARDSLVVLGVGPAGESLT